MLARNLGRAALAAAVWLAVAVGVPDQALAYTPLQPPPPTDAPVDSTNVNVFNGQYSFTVPEVSIGQPDFGGLAYARTWLGSGWRDSLTGTINSASNIYTVSFGSVSETFTLSGGVYTQDQGLGSTLSFNSGTQVYTYTATDGTVALFAKALAGTLPTNANEGRITSLTRPTGEKLTYTYKTVTVGSLIARLQSVETTLGYQLRLSYTQNTTPTTGQVPNWINVIKVTGVDLGTLYCDPAADSCAGIPASWPSATYGVPVDNPLAQTVTDQLQRVTRYTLDANGRMVGVRRPSSASDNVVVGYVGGSFKVGTVTDGAGTWTYTYYIFQGQTFVTDSTGVTRSTTLDMSTGRVVAMSSSSPGGPTSFEYDSFGRLRKAIRPEDDYTQFDYDARGNVIQITEVAKPGSGLSNIVTTASYDASCTHRVKCNKPNSTTDARGATTNYTYDTTHGGVLTITAPPPTVGAVRPQTRFGYSSLYAWYQNSSGSIVQAPTAVTRPTTTSACVTTSSCAGGSDEVKTTIAYGPTGVANHLLPVGVSSGSGDGALTATTTVTYDVVGNLLTQDGPLAGTGDTWRYRYDNGRQVVGVVSPDPDGAGPLKNRAIRNTFNLDGQVTLAEEGTVNSQSDPDWANFISLEQLATAYDAQGRKVKDTLQASGSTHAAVQYSYDGAGRSQCTAVRMNPATFGSLPSSACTLATTGSNGPDRVTRNTYDNKGRLQVVTSAYGTTAARDDLIATYTTNQETATVADAKNNLTTYEYDGFDRLVKIRYPSPTTPGTSSTTDYEQYTYDPNSNVTQDRHRNGSSFTFTYDALNRETVGQFGSTFAYDNLSRLTNATRANLTSTFTWDALSRLTSETKETGTVSYQYDLASRRTRLTWPDSFYVTYDYLLTDDMTAIRENGAASGIGVLATYAYDNLGRRVSLTRGNGSETIYTYDAVSWLTSLGTDLAGTSADNTFSFTRNAAGQVLTRQMTNSAYHPSMAGASKSYTINGLNQVTSVAGTGVTYDGQGNITGDGTRTWGYDVANQMTTTTNVAFNYDALGRMARTNLSGVNNRLAYDGVELVTEYTSGNVLLRRYVHGPAFDEPLVWYEGSGTTNRRWLAADDLGSVVTVMDAAAQPLAVNTYDEYGKPGAANLGRFQYTGQAWRPEAGVYYYKARMYNPELGRFMQPDPIGYDDGMNMYAYVGNDPVNAVDPTGLATIWCTEIPGHPAGKKECACEGGPDMCILGGADILIDNRRPWLQRGGGGQSRGGGGGGKTSPPPPSDQCPAVPPAPPGASVDENMRATAHMGVIEFYNMVRNRGPWDYKQHGEQYQDFGNFNFGATATSQGSFPKGFISRMAGWAQERAGTSKPNWGDPLGSRPYGDDPADQKMIDAGMKYRALGCIK